MSVWAYIINLFSGWMSVFAAFFLYFALTGLIRVKEKWWCKVLLHLNCWQTCVMIIYIGDTVNLSASLLMFMPILWITCEGSGLKKLTLGLMFSSTVYAFSGFWDNCVAYWAHIFGLDPFYANLYLYGRLFFAATLYLVIRFQKTDKDFELSKPLWRLMLLLTFSPLGIMFSVILLTSPFMEIRGILITDSVLFLVVILSFIGLLRALMVLEKQQKLERENLLANQNQRYYEAMEQQQFEIRRLRHDLANHLQTLLALPASQKDDYVKGMLDQPAFGKVLTWCGDATVNAVLTAKEGMMRQRGIHFHAKADIPEELSFEKADLCAVFANALDNAVEGCAELEESMREIHLEAKAGKGILAVNIRNACPLREMASEEKDILPRTTKKDAKNHGFGLRSIQEIVKKYGGSMEVEQMEGEFNLFLYLPIPV